MGQVEGRPAYQREVYRASQTHPTSAHIASLTSNRGRYNLTASVAWRSTQVHRFGSSAYADDPTGLIPVGASLSMASRSGGAPALRAGFDCEHRLSHAAGSPSRPST